MLYALLTFAFALAQEQGESEATEDNNQDDAFDFASEETEAEEQNGDATETPSEEADTESEESTSEEGADSTEAEESTPTEEDTPQEQTTGPALDLSSEGVESLDNQLTEEQLDFLKPTRGKLPQNPYQHVDFTAYTLEWGEAQIGLNRSSVGVLPRTQIGTQVLLDVIGIYNVNAKVNALRLGPFDLAITGNYMTLPSENFSINYYGLGGFGSLRILENWSMHTGIQYSNLAINGFPDVNNFGPLLTTFAGLSQDDIDQISSAVEDSVNYERQERVVAVDIASDVRLNRRDSIILQGSVTSSSNDGEGLNADVEGVEISLQPEDISSPLFQFLLVPEENQFNYSASVAYQASFKRAYMRLGLGFSNIPYSWILQSIDFTWRFGGQTKRRANTMQKVWELNKKALESGADKRE